MDAEFWHRIWEEGQLGFHGPEANPRLLNHCHRLALEPGARIFMPLCGKTLDISWLLSQGYRVVGAELSPVAVGQLFESLGQTPKIQKVGAFNHYAIPNLDIYQGDIFDLNAEILGAVDGIYDRAALVALPPEMRRRYTSHLRSLAPDVPQLLICYEYDQSLLDGPPFSIPEAEVREHYAGHYALERIEKEPFPHRLKGEVDALVYVWVMKNT